MEELKNLYVQGRTVLKDKIPLKMPLCISIEPTNICNFKCVMCYHGNNEDADEAKPLCNMSDDTFKKTLKDIIEWVGQDDEKVKLIKLYSLGEPLVNRHITQMLSEIKKADICEKVEITTNGSLLTPEISEKFVESGLDIIRFSIYGMYPEHNHKVTNSNVNPEQILDNIKKLRSIREEKKTVKPKIIAKMFRTNTEEDNLFYSTYAEIADEIGFDEPFHLNSGENDIFERLYDEKADEMHRQSLESNFFKQKKACRYPFTHMTIRNDGSVIVCCADWLKELSYGNVKESSLKELWNGEKLYQIRCEMLKTKGLCFNVCKDCEIPYRDLPEDSVDEIDIAQLKRG